MITYHGSNTRPGIPGRSSTLFVVSDGGGSTAEAAMDAAMAQFPDVAFTIVRRPGVRSREQVLAVVREASLAQGIIVHTIVIQEIRQILVRECRQRVIPNFDLIGPLIGHIGQQVGQRPILRPGASRGIDLDYFKRIDAIQFTVQHDDGQSLSTLHEADVVLVGVSRSSKTPLSVFLSMRGWRVANIPIVLGVEPPQVLGDIDQRRIVAVTLDAPQLLEIRRNRLQALGQLLDGEYADPDKITEELAFFRRVARSGYPWPIVNVTGKSVEEAAKEVIAVVEGQRVSDDRNQPHEAFSFYRDRLEEEQR
ncbi:MAG TPA: pyruvate, water dikinase regulatory protein [Thermomicrobiales bacterium]|nr:pyruvate, water dikinase regulatory protein [Thermomicrobiales bacterium]